MNKRIESLRGESSQEVDRPENWFDNITYLRMFFASASSDVELLRCMNEVKFARREAGYDRHLRLSELVFFGKWWSDSDGNLYRITRNLPDNVREYSASLNNVVPGDDFWNYLKANGIEHIMSTLDGLPPAGICCPDCKQPWDMSTVADAVETRPSQDVSLDEFVGLPLGEAIKKIQENNQEFAIWRIQSDAAVSNPAYIDTSPAHPGTSVQKNSAGVLRGDQSEHVIQPGDIAHFTVWEFRHSDCQKKRNEQFASEYYRDLFADAGYTASLSLVPNEHNPDPIRASPWACIELPFAKITIGWRHSVISISVENNDAVDLKTLFSEEGSRMDTKFIHAWTREKAVEYLKAIKAKYDVAQQ